MLMNGRHADDKSAQCKDRPSIARQTDLVEIGRRFEPMFGRNSQSRVRNFRLLTYINLLVLQYPLALLRSSDSCGGKEGWKSELHEENEGKRVGRCSAEIFAPRLYSGFPVSREIWVARLP
jgi:hypothetical protein